MQSAADPGLGGRGAVYSGAQCSRLLSRAAAWRDNLAWRLWWTAGLVFALAFLYTGSYWNPQAHYKSLQVAVLSCDAGAPAALVSVLPPQLGAVPLGTALLAGSVFNVTSPAAKLLGWSAYTCNAAMGAPSCAAVASACRAELVDAVESGRVWSALFVPSTFTSAVLSNSPTLAPATGFASPSIPIVEHIISTGRGYSTYTTLTIIVNNTVAGVVQGLGTMLAANPVVAAMLRPAYFVTPAKLVQTDLHPVNNYGQTMVAQTSFVCLYIGSMFNAFILLNMKRRVDSNGVASQLSTREALRLIGRRLALGVTFCFIHAIAVVAVILCLGNYSTSSAHDCQWARNPGVAIAYCAYMAWCFMTMNAVMLGISGEDGYSTFATFMLILQSCCDAGVFSDLLSTKFFKIGRGLPWYYGVRALRTIFFGGQANWMPINWMVPTVWNAGLSIAYVAAALHSLCSPIHAEMQKTIEDLAPAVTGKEIGGV